jgi:transcriptional regulator with XRE-family HTH domain
MRKRRRLKNLRQKEVAFRAGIPLGTYRRLERGLIKNPPVRYLVNVSLVLEVNLRDVCENDWLEWTVFRPGQPRRPPKR